MYVVVNVLFFGYCLYCVAMEMHLESEFIVTASANVCVCVTEERYVFFFLSINSSV